MSVTIKCPHCKTEFGSWEPYAHHVLQAHADDIERCVWANNALAAKDGQPTSNVTRVIPKIIKLPKKTQ